MFKVGDRVRGLGTNPSYNITGKGWEGIVTYVDMDDGSFIASTTKITEIVRVHPIDKVGKEWGSLRPRYFELVPIKLKSNCGKFADSDIT